MRKGSRDIGQPQMSFTRNQTIAILLIAALVFGFTLLHASWLAPEPEGEPKLVADHAAEPVRDTAGCVASANSGFGGTVVGADVAALQAAAGKQADAVRITTEMVDGKLVLAQQFESECAADKARPYASLAEVAAGMTRPELFWQVAGTGQADALLASLPSGAMERSAVIGDQTAVAHFRKAQTTLWTFSTAGARACASDYRLSGMWGSVPASCRGGTMLLTFDDLGYTLWGWPDRFLARMKEANVRLIIAEDVVDAQIKGLTDVHQYGDIADSYNGYIWVDNIEELGPALRR